jgi:hypothetical protein
MPTAATAAAPPYAIMSERNAGLKSEAGPPKSRLRLRTLWGLAFVGLGVQEMLAWAQFMPFNFGWLMRLARDDWMEPFAGLISLAVGGALAGPAIVEAFSGRDNARKRARRTALAWGCLAGIAGLAIIETLIPSRDALPGSGRSAALPRSARQLAVVWSVFAVTGTAGFIVARRRDVGFQKLIVPVQRGNEIWNLELKAEVAFRAVARNEEARQLLEQRLEFVQAEVGAKFDELCEPLIQESADLCTIDNTARLHLDVGHVFKRYADFHRRLAATRKRLCEDIREAAYKSIYDLLENQLPGQDFAPGFADEVRVTISHPVLTDTISLQRRRSEWDETLRTVVHAGAESGTRIVGEWLERAARGEVSVEEVPLAAQALQALAQGSAEDSKVKALTLDAS